MTYRKRDTSSVSPQARHLPLQGRQERGVPAAEGGGLWRFRVYGADGIEMLGSGLVHALNAEQATSKVRGVRSRWRDAMIFVRRYEDTSSVSPAASHLPLLGRQKEAE